MNKLLVVEDIKKVKTGEYQISSNVNAHIMISGEVIIHEYDNKTNHFSIELEKNSHLTFYQVKHLNSDYHIHIKLKEGATLSYHTLFLNREKHKVTMDIEMIENNAKANVLVRALNLENHSNLDIVCEGLIASNTIDNELVENLKGLIIHDDDSIKISPIMKVDTNEVMANHFVTIGPFNREELFYLMMRGLSIKKAQELLKTSFLVSIMSDFEKEKLKWEVKNNE